MAVNVFLIVFRRYDAEALKRLEWKYMVGITTITFIPAFSFLFVKNDDQGHLYGSVTVGSFSEGDALGMRQMLTHCRYGAQSLPNGSSFVLFSTTFRYGMSRWAGFSPTNADPTPFSHLQVYDSHCHGAVYAGWSGNLQARRCLPVYQPIFYSATT
jgi:hypothetical protein